MARYILRYSGSGAAPAADVERIRVHPAAKVVDDTSSRMMLVDVDEADAPTLAAELPGWVVARDQTIPLPDTRARVKRAPRSTRS